MKTFVFSSFVFIWVLKWFVSFNIVVLMWTVLLIVNVLLWVWLIKLSVINMTNPHK